MVIFLQCFWWDVLKQQTEGADKQWNNWKKRKKEKENKKIGIQPVMRGKGAGWKLLLNAFWSKTSAWQGAVAMVTLNCQRYVLMDDSWASIRQILRLEEQKERERVEASCSSAPLLVLTMTWCLSYCASQHTHTQFLSLKLPWCPREGEVNAEAGCHGWN